MLVGAVRVRKAVHDGELVFVGAAQVVEDGFVFGRLRDGRQAVLLGAGDLAAAAVEADAERGVGEHTVAVGVAFEVFRAGLGRKRRRGRGGGGGGGRTRGLQELSSGKFHHRISQEARMQDHWESLHKCGGCRAPGTGTRLVPPMVRIAA